MQVLRLIKVQTTESEVVNLVMVCLKDLINTIDAITRIISSALETMITVNRESEITTIQDRAIESFTVRINRCSIRAAIVIRGTITSHNIRIGIKADIQEDITKMIDMMIAVAPRVELVITTTADEIATSHEATTREAVQTMAADPSAEVSRQSSKVVVSDTEQVVKQGSEAEAEVAAPKMVEKATSK